MINFEPTTGIVTIKFVENQGEAIHIFEEKPVKLILHPKNGEIMRCQFEGLMPPWLYKYTLTNNYNCQQVSEESNKGWWLSLWEIGDFIAYFSPSIEGAIQYLNRQIPWACNDLKEKIKNNKQIVAHNLISKPGEYEKYGLYFREEIMKKAGCSMYAEPDLFPIRMESEEEADFIERVDSGDLPDLIWELTTSDSQDAESVSQTTLIAESVIKLDTTELETDNLPLIELALNPAELETENPPLTGKESNSAELETENMPLIELELETELELEPEPLVLEQEPEPLIATNKTVPMNEEKESPINRFSGYTNIAERDLKNGLLGGEIPLF